MKFFKDWHQNLDDYQILQELDDHGILVKFQRDFDKNSFQDWNDHGIIQVFCSELFSRIRWPQNSYIRLHGFWSEFRWPTLVTSQIWIDTIVDYVSNEIEVWGRMEGSKEARKNGDIEALADAMRALKNTLAERLT